MDLMTMIVPTELRLLHYDGYWVDLAMVWCFVRRSIAVAVVGVEFALGAVVGAVRVVALVVWVVDYVFEKDWEPSS